MRFLSYIATVTPYKLQTVKLSFILKSVHCEWQRKTTFFGGSDSQAGSQDMFHLGGKMFQF